MATITTSVYLDSAARTAGEAMTIDGGTLTIRTDTRWHANSPASMTGALSSVTISATLGGEYILDATKVRWLEFNSGTGNVPSIGTSITQGAVSGVLLGVWASITSAPTAVAAAMPTSGFIKFREVTGGTFTAGALTNIGASAVGADKVGWIEVVHDQAATITVPRLGKFKTRGDWFELGTTNGTVGQVFQLPSNNGGVGTTGCGAWIETAPSSGIYDFWTGLYTSTNGWAVSHISSPNNGGVNSDIRQSFSKILASGQMQLGEDLTQASTYTTTAIPTATYTWASNIVTVASTAHGLRVGEKVYLDFTTGGATADGVYEVLTATTANAFTVALTGSGTGGSCTGYAKSVVTFTAHGLAVGNKVYCDFTTGTAADGIYIVETVPSTSTYTVNTAPSTNTSGNVSVKYTLGRVPVSGCKVRVPNIFMRQCATGTRAANAVPNATIATRPEFETTSAGAIDVEYVYGDWYFNLVQPYSVTMKNSAILDTLILQECATPINLDNLQVGMYGALDVNAINLASNFAGGSIKNCKFERGNTPSTTDHSVSIGYCNDIVFDNVQMGIVQFVRSTGYPISMSYCNGVQFKNCRCLNGTFNIVASQNILIENYDYVDRYIGITNATTAYYAILIGAGCVNIDINGITVGFGGIVPDVHPYTGLVNYSASVNVKIRRIGTKSVPISAGSIPVYAMGTAYVSGGNNNGVKVQRLYITPSTLRSGLMTDSNSDKNVIYESVHAGSIKAATGVVSAITYGITPLECVVKGMQVNLNTTIGQSSVYGTHWMDIFTSNTAGRVVSIMNEPTSNTISLNTLTVQGLGGFTSAGTLSLQTLNDEYITEMPYVCIGHNSFANIAPTITATNPANHTFYYQIDVGSGWNGTWKLLNATNLSGETISASVGFRLKYRIVCTTASTTNVVTYIRIDTVSSLASQVDNLYPLDVITAKVSLTGLVDGTEVGIYRSSDMLEYFHTDGTSGGTATYNYNYTIDIPVYIVIHNKDYVYIKINTTLTANNLSIPIQQQLDRWYSNPV